MLKDTGILLIGCLFVTCLFQHRITTTKVGVHHRCKLSTDSPDGQCSSLNLHEDLVETWLSGNCHGCTCFKRPSDDELVIDCSSMNLTEIPKSFPNETFELYLSNNEITHIEPGVFVNLFRVHKLDLSNNYVEFVNANSFEGLNALHILNLRYNNINLTMLPTQVFMPLINLTTLHLEQGGMVLRKKDSIPIWALDKLSKLKDLTIDGLDWTDTTGFHKNFSKLHHLYNLELTGICLLPIVRQGMFMNVQKLRQLKINGLCHVQTIENTSFSELKNLKRLDLSSNTLLTFSSLRNISLSLQGTKVEFLNLSAIETSVGFCTRICSGDIKPLRNTTLKHLYLDSNRLAGFGTDAYAYLPASLELLSLGSNQITLSLYVQLNVYAYRLPNINALILSKQNWNEIQRFFEATYIHQRDYLETETFNCGVVESSERKYRQLNLKNDNIVYENSSCDNCYVNQTKIHLPASLQRIDLRDMRVRLAIHGFCLCQPNNLQILLLSRNTYWEFYGPIYGGENLTHLDLSWNSCQNIGPNVLWYLSNLIHLNISRNFLGYAFGKDNGTIFMQQHKLQFLDMSDNKITHLQRNVFAGLKSIKCLFLANNLLNTFNIDISRMACLQYLDVSNNYLKTLTPDMSAQFDSLASHVNYHISIDLSDNRLSCKCDQAKFVSWISETKIKFVDQYHYECKYENGSVARLKNPKQITDHLRILCETYTVLIILSLCFLCVFMIIIISGILYRYRWDLWYLYYSSKIKNKGYKPFIDDDNDFKYDAFVSFSETEGVFVKQNMITALEGHRGLKLLIHERDFRPGTYVAENVVNAIISSRKTLVIMSNGFLKSNWCIYEMNMARIESIQTRRNLLCIVMTEEVPVESMPVETVQAIRQQTYLRLPEDVNNMELFWDRLQDALKEE